MTIKGRHSLHKDDLVAVGQIEGDTGTATTSANACTINKMAGVVTTGSLTTAGGASQAITINNNEVAATDIVSVDWAGGTNTVANFNYSCVPSAGVLTLTIYNNTAATAFNGTFIFHFSIIKARNTARP